MSILCLIIYPPISPCMNSDWNLAFDTFLEDMKFMGNLLLENIAW